MTTSKKVQAAETEILRLVQRAAPSARLVSSATRESYSCAIIVETDEEKRRINCDLGLLEEMKEAAGEVGRAPDYLSAESQETVDRRWGGDWNYVFR